MEIIDTLTLHIISQSNHVDIYLFALAMKVNGNSYAHYAYLDSTLCKYSSSYSIHVFYHKHEKSEIAQLLSYHRGIAPAATASEYHKDNICCIYMHMVSLFLWWKEFS